jgi:hypothetical protein
MPFGTYPRCTDCEHKVTQVIDRVIKGKRHQLCISCARKAGWFDEDKEPEQQQLWKE